MGPQPLMAAFGSNHISRYFLRFHAAVFTLLLVCVPLLTLLPELHAQGSVSTAAVVTDQSSLDLSTKFGTPQGAVNAAGDYAFVLWADRGGPGIGMFSIILRPRENVSEWNGPRQASGSL